MSGDAVSICNALPWLMLNYCILGSLSMLGAGDGSSCTEKRLVKNLRCAKLHGLLLRVDLAWSRTWRFELTHARCRFCRC